MQPNHQCADKGKEGLDTLHPVMIIVPFILFLFQHTLATSTDSQLTETPTNLNTERRPIDLGSVLGKEWNTVGSHTNEIVVLSIAEGTYIGRDIKIAHRSLDLTGKESFHQNVPIILKEPKH
ncbi:hypothetical protein BLNAU_23257 [Blattamonas nauphoetae]|uniref:Dirigent protein n=1 Tax=Blattamonas nauphoetae TaxID=2049346 RepID=A0ABQ9WQT5_9EUKA|nr:hypothetical protein BLNAU_23257 [Blattamonas nauphoetae]